MKKVFLLGAVFALFIAPVLVVQAQQVIDSNVIKTPTPKFIPGLQADPCRISRNDGDVAGDGNEVITGCVTNVEFGRMPNSCIVSFANQQFLVPEAYNGICQLAIASATLRKRVISYTRPANIEGSPNAAAADIIFMKLDL